MKTQMCSNIWKRQTIEVSGCGQFMRNTALVVSLQLTTVGIIASVLRSLAIHGYVDMHEIFHVYKLM